MGKEPNEKYQNAQVSEGSQKELYFQEFRTNGKRILGSQLS